MEESSGRMVGELTVEELKNLIRDVVREELRSDYYIDEDGRLAFSSEEGYVAYVARQAGRRPSELNAYYLDASGRKAVYADDQPIPARPPALARRRNVDEEPAPAERRHDYHFQSSTGDPREAALRRLRDRT